MLKNYWKIAWRQLVRNKLHTSINVGGLIIGFTIGIAILLIVYQQCSYDNFQANRHRIYEAYQVFNHPGHQDIANEFAMAQGPAYKAEAPAIERMTRILDGGNHIQYNGRDLTIPVMLVDQDYFDLFSFPVVRGAHGNPLQSLTSIVLREDAARQIFGKEDPIGKTVKASVGNKLQDLVVTAVVKEGLATSLNYLALARIENLNNYSAASNDWGDRGLYLYVELKTAATQRQAELQLKTVDQKHVPGWNNDLIKENAKPDTYGDLWATRLLPLADVHFSTRVNGHKAVGYALLLLQLAVAVFIILIACFNFVNISLAAAFTRSREIGVRKCLGAAKGKLFLQLWGESLLVCTVAFTLSLLLFHMLLDNIDGLASVRDALSAYSWQPGFLLLAFCLLLVVSLLAGGYPSWLMTRVDLVETLKGRLSIRQKSPLRNSLIVLQFVIACVMISCTLIFYKQYRFLENADTGIDKDNIVSIPMHDTGNSRDAIAKLRVLLLSDPRIACVTGSNINLGRGSDHRTVTVGTDFTYHGRRLSINVASVDYDYLKTLGIRPLDGRDFDRTFSMDTANKILISESLAKQLGEKDPVGIYIGGDSSWRGNQVIGVFPDFHLYSLAEEQHPLMLTFRPHDPVAYCFIRVTGHDPLGAMASIKKAMAQVEPNQDFHGTYVSDNIDDWYSGARTISLLFSIAAGIAILLSCSGLLALVLLILQQRIKEIGIRKVLGASVGNISLIVSKEFLRLVLLAVLIATPLSWLAMYKWLETLPYRIHIRIWMFVLVGLIALLLALLTIAINTIRAARQNPIKALRSE
jgi:putative ABC transport system permease protein